MWSHVDKAGGSIAQTSCGVIGRLLRTDVYLDVDLDFRARQFGKLSHLQLPQIQQLRAVAGPLEVVGLLERVDATSPQRPYVYLTFFGASESGRGVDYALPKAGLASAATRLWTCVVLWINNERDKLLSNRIYAAVLPAVQADG
ncbi:hypothetical protein HK100_003031 [Physocladia obscura]|uniref:Uncharacterized protein n=1 Tax=Physocladia obscura TaxID=109957 RepID=A0AAD5XDT9_9FUNG|nr:hypothetical protein HK100_003031 [Physocladia obscura]